MSYLGLEKNNAGGFSYEVDDEVRLLRFLILGTEGGTYYCSERDLRRENVQCIDRLIMANKGESVVKLITDVSVYGRSCKQSPLIYALAVCARSNDLKTKNKAYRSLSDICRIPTHLFEFVKYCERESAGTGWGRAHKTAIQKWYNNHEDPKKLAYHVTKYQSRHSWSHRDVLRLCHIKPKNDALGTVIRYLIRGLSEPEPVSMEEDGTVNDVLEFLNAVDTAKKCTDVDKLRELIAVHKLAREHIPTGMLDSPEVWDTLLRTMPMTAMIRNLGKMSQLKLLDLESFGEDYVITKLGRIDLLKQTRIHPFTVLIAWYQYQRGEGDKGKLKWPVNQKIVHALEKAFYYAFQNVEATEKRYLLAVDVSGSMTDPVHGSSVITCREAAAAMMLVTAKKETNVEVVAFCEKLTKMDITAKDDMKSVIDKCSQLSPRFGRTDCALPMKHAYETKKMVDVFIVYTDSETFFGNMHPSRALEEYRKYSKIKDARLIVVGMASNGFTIADPCDRYMLDVVGFDTEAPKAMTSFIKGEI